MHDHSEAELQAAVSFEAVADKARKAKAPADAEITAMSKIVKMLDALEGDASERVITWIYNRYCMRSA